MYSSRFCRLAATQSATQGRILTGSIGVLAALLAPAVLQAAPATPRERLSTPAVESVGATALPEIVVTDEAPASPEAQVAQALEETREDYAGSVTTVTPEELAVQKTNNLGEVLARIPGASYVDEDGRGTRPDIGLRGLNPIRSEYVQLLLDGVPVQPSLYSETAAYYGTPAERVFGIEVFKGGSGVLFGPNTVGGVVNLISRPPSLRPFAAVIDTRYDSWGDYSGNVFLSGAHGPISYGVEYMHKGGDGFRDSLGYNIDDLDIKLGIRFNDQHSAQVRFQYFEEKSETPGGLLPRQFHHGDITETNKPHDEFFGKRVAGDVRTTHLISDAQRVDLLFYASHFERDWFLQNYADNTSADLTLADSNQQFLRDFLFLGFEPRYTLNYDIGNSTGHELVIGGRLYYDSVNRRTAVGNHAESREGDNRFTAEDELSTFVLAAFVQNEVKFTSRFSMTPGVRYEHIDQSRTDVFADTPEQESSYDVWVPGIGAKYEIAPKTLVYANASRSFRAPSFGDTFNPTIGASSLDLKPSTAWTYETGVRANPYPWIFADLGVFYTDFQDQVVVTGNTAGNFDTESYGFEGVVEVGLFGLAHVIRTGDPLYTGDHEVSLMGGATLVESSFEAGPFVGNDLPYVPNQTITFGVKYEFQELFDLVFQGRYVSERFTDGANTVVENEVGTIGVLADYTVFDLKSRWQVNEHLALNAGVNNIFDESYATQRRTDTQKGIFPGPTRQFYVGATFSF